MSLDKAIAHGKEHRKPYTKSKRICKSCRNHGGCPWCEENRKHKFRDKHPVVLFDSTEEDIRELWIKYMDRLASEEENEND